MGLWATSAWPAPMTWLSTAGLPGIKSAPVLRLLGCFLAVASPVRSPTATSVWFPSTHALLVLRAGALVLL